MSAEQFPTSTSEQEQVPGTPEQEVLYGSTPYKPFPMAGPEGQRQLSGMLSPGTSEREWLDDMSTKVGGPVYVETNPRTIKNPDGTEQDADIFGIGSDGRIDQQLGLFTRVWDDKEKGISHIEKVTVSRPSKPSVTVASSRY